MNFQTAIRTCLSKYATFSGRARRSEYWFYTLGVFLAAFIAAILDRILEHPASGLGIIYAVVLLGTFLPSLAVGVRRLHDTDRSGWWYFIVLVPILGAILLLVWFCTKGTDGDNRFGPDPTKA